MAGRQLPFVSLIVPAWLVVTMSGWRGLRGRLAGRARLRRRVRRRAVLLEQLRRPRARRHRRRPRLARARWRVFCRVWKPARGLGVPGSTRAAVRTRCSAASASAAGAPCVARGCRGSSSASLVTLWGLGSVKAFLNGGPHGLRGVPRRQPPVGQPGAVAELGRAAAPSPGVPRLPGRSRSPSIARASTIRSISRHARRGGALHAQLALGHRHRHPLRRHRHGAVSAASRSGRCSSIAGMTFTPHAQPAADDRADAVARLRHPLRRHRRHARAGVHEDRVALSVLRRVPRLARRRADRLGHQLERALRQPAEDHGAAARPRTRSSS